jgi:hypothetical protein
MALRLEAANWSLYAACAGRRAGLNDDDQGKRKSRSWPPQAQAAESPVRRARPHDKRSPAELRFERPPDISLFDTPRSGYCEVPSMRFLSVRIEERPHAINKTNLLASDTPYCLG